MKKQQQNRRRMQENGKRQSTRESGTKKQAGRARGQNNRKSKSVRKKKNKFGKILLVLQAIVSILFLLSLSWLGMLPMKYIVLVAIVLLCLWLIGVLSQVNRKKSGIYGKIYSIFLIIVLSIGVFYIAKTTNLIGQISGNAYKTEKVVVAVLEEDAAQSLQDTADYQFGVQFDKGAESLESALVTMEEEMGQDISVTQYDNMEEQAMALHTGEVQAIIYDNAYGGIIENTLSEYGEKVRVIYSTHAKVKLDIAGGRDDSLIEEPFTVYISGLDVYEDTVDQGSRSDVNIIAVVNPKTHQILLVTTPRDYYVVIPGVSEGMYDKLTHAGSYGIDTSMATLGELYETDINYYAQLNFTALIEIVDILGGLDVESEYAFTTSEDSGYVMDVQQGLNHFDGIQALAFARERQNVEGGDLQRGRDQQAVITAMIKKMLSPTMLLKANSILNTVSRNVETSITPEQINSLIRYQLSENPKWSIVSLSAEGEPGEDTCYSAGGEVLSIVYPDEESIQYIIDQVNIVEEGTGTLEGAEKLN